MKERPILFNGEMVRAVLGGTKTQTRRVVEPRSDMEVDLITNPYGQPGDRLWVRETWWSTKLVSHPSKEESLAVAYRADMPDAPYGGKWKPSIFMPRAASRITLEIISVRVERVQEISREDARAEGVLLNFHLYWDSSNKKRGYSWKSNPWVWCITFRQVARA